MRFFPLSALLHHLSGEDTGIYIADSTSLSVCHPRRIYRHKVFEGLAQRGKTIIICYGGWFFGMKLHIVINDKGQIMAVKITPGNTDDRAMLESMLDSLKGSWERASIRR